MSKRLGSVKASFCRPHFSALFGKALLLAATEADKLFLIDKAEFRQMAARLVTSARVDFASLASSAKLRGVAVTDLFQNSESIISSF